MLKKIPHTITIIFSLIVFCAILTWVIPAGEFARHTVMVNGMERNVISPDSYHRVEATPQTWQIFSALIDGFQKQSGIIAFVLIIGGAFQILNSSKAIDIGILSFLSFTKKLERWMIVRKIGVNNIIITLVMLVFSLFGGVFGMSEETLAFIIIIVPLAISMGYDSITGFCMVYVAAHVGFSGAMLNPFTIGIAQGLSDLPLFSGIEYRILCWIILTVFIISIVLLYAARIKKNPQRSPMYKLDEYWRKREIDAEHSNFSYSSTKASWGIYAAISGILIYLSVIYPETVFKIGEQSYSTICLPIVATLFVITGFITAKRSYHLFILNILAFTIIILIIGVMGYQWYITEIAALFLAMGVCSGIAMGANADTVVKEFIVGNKDMITAALVVGLAGGIIQILTEGRIMDTILNSMAELMDGAGKTASLMGMYFIQSVINIFIPSGSAKAALTMPIMAPFSDVIGISRQATVMAFQFGDGFTNMITPTSAVLVGALGIAKIPYEIWIKWFYKLIIMLLILGALLLIPTVMADLNGF